MPLSLSSRLVVGGLAVAALGAVADRSVVSWSAKRWKNIQPAAEERKFDRIGWAPTLLTAIQRAKQLNRPVFVHTYDGDLATGRC